MPRLELLMCLLAGMSGGLIGVLWGHLVSIPWIASAANPVARLAPESMSRLVAHAVLLAAAGAALGFLFWLGWALVALVNAAWYVAGVVFGLLAWAGTALALAAVLALRFEGFGRVALVMAVEWLVTCLSVGILCAFAWHRYA